MLLWVADLSRGAGITKDAGKEPVVLDYLDSFLMASIDAALAAQNAAVAAESMSLGIVYLGVMRNIAKEVADIINLHDYSFVTFGMAVGLPDDTRTSSVRPRPAQPSRWCYITIITMRVVIAPVLKDMKPPIRHSVSARI